MKTTPLVSVVTTGWNHSHQRFVAKWGHLPRQAQDPSGQPSPASILAAPE